MRILVTGGAGMVGSHAAKYYANQGHEVIVLDNLIRSRLFGCNLKSVEFNWDYLRHYENVKLIKGDVRSREDTLKSLGNGVDVVIHTAGQPGVPLSLRNPEEDFSINALGTLNLLQCVRQKCSKAKFIYCSTNKVYGENVDQIPLAEKDTRYEFNRSTGVSENMPIDQTGHTFYGASKYVADLYTQEYARMYGMSTAVFRMSCIYGARQFGFEDQGWVAWFVIANLTNKPVTIYGNGKQVRDLLYVTDLIDAFNRFITSNLTHDVFNIGGGHNQRISLLEFLGMVEKKTGKPGKIEFADWRTSDQKVYVSDISKIKEKLGWEPSIGIEEGLDRLIRWAEQNIDLFRLNHP